MKTFKFFLIACSLLFVVACSDDDENDVDTNQLINPADSDALSAVLVMPTGATQQNGIPPSSSNSSTAPNVNNNVSTIVSSNGSTAPLTFGYTNITGNIGGCYIQVDGAGNYYTVPYNSNSSSSGDLQVPIGIPTNVDAGEFCVSFCVYDVNGLVSNVVNTCVTVLRLGTGALQVSLSWNNTTDQDLYVTDPSGETISYTNTFATSGGELDRDDTDGYGPENIFWSEEAPDGQYTVEVDDYTGSSSPTSFFVTVNGPNTSRTFSGTTQNGSQVEVVRFTKSGDNIIF